MINAELQNWQLDLQLAPLGRVSVQVIDIKGNFYIGFLETWEEFDREININTYEAYTYKRSLFTSCDKKDNTSRLSNREMEARVS